MTVPEEQIALPTYTIRQLALRNGQDRDEIWVAYRGRIYDVSRSRLWRRGNHYVFVFLQKFKHKFNETII